MPKRQLQVNHFKEGKSMHCRRQMFISLSLSSVLLISSWSVALAQTPQTPASPDEVLRISTDLVQTDLVVLDKKGKNVKGLSKDDFELLVDGQRQNISFFENVNAGSLKEATQWASAREQLCRRYDDGAVTCRFRAGTLIHFLRGRLPSFSRGRSADRRAAEQLRQQNGRRRSRSANVTQWTDRIPATVDRPQRRVEVGDFQNQVPVESGCVQHQSPSDVALRSFSHRTKSTRHD